jgi:hypothetical protein
VFYEAGGVNPVPVAEPVGHYLSFAEREEPMRLDAAGLGSAPSAGPGTRSGHVQPRRFLRSLRVRSICLGFQRPRWDEIGNFATPRE